MDSDNNKNNVLGIIIHYGLTAQLDQLTEECAELIQAINKFKRFNKDAQTVDINNAPTNLLEEIADIEVIFDQLKALIPEIIPIINNIKKEKIQRQIQRINEEIAWQERMDLLDEAYAEEE